jgi:hypothetical protein
MAIWRSFIAEKAMPFGDHLSLKKQWRSGYVLSLNICWQFGNTHLLNFAGNLARTYC